MLVQHQDGGQVDHRRPGRRPGPHHGGAPRAWAQSSGITARGSPIRRRRTPEVPRPRRPRAARISAWPRRPGGQHQRQPVGRRAAAAPRSAPSGPSGRRTPPRPASSPVVGTGWRGTQRVGHAGDGPRRRRRAQEGHGPAGPATGGPVGQVDQVRGGPHPVTLASGRRTVPSGGSTSTATTQPPTRRPCSSMRTRVPTPTARHPVRDEVVEGVSSAGTSGRTRTIDPGRAVGSPGGEWDVVAF